MWLKITKKHLRRCPEFLQLCLKIAGSYDGEYLDDDDENEVCQDCVEDFAQAIPGEQYCERRMEHN